MKHLKKHSLKSYNTFGIDVNCSHFIEVHSVEDLIKIYTNQKFTSLKKLIIGGGSNILFTQDFDGIVIKNSLKGIRLITETNDYFIVSAMAGENWHEFVLHTLKNSWFGLENLSLIPGCVGASPMQNIGAYGVEIKDRCIEVEALNLETLQLELFSAEDCQFGYRESVFKRALKGQYIITSVNFRLYKSPQLNTSYGAIENELKEMNISNPTPKDVSDAVITIRTTKLPDPKKIGNGGSFFKNPVISNDLFESVKIKFPSIAHYSAGDGFTKIAAGWLIDQAGWKGYSKNDFGVHKNQALVLVNYGNATGKEIYDLSSEIIASIKDKYGIELEREINVI